MIPSHRILPSNAPPMGADRILRHTSGNANFSSDEKYLVDGEKQDDSSDDDSEPEQNVRVPIKGPRRIQANGLPYDGSNRSTTREARADRHAKSNRLRALAQDPSSIFVAKYEDRLTGRKFERRERIAEAILPDEKAQWQHHMLEEQVKEQQRKQAYLDRERKELVKRGENAGQVVWSRLLDDAYQIAIRCVPPILGKKKMSIPDGHGGTRLAGRNELISRKIYQLTEQRRYRKQISSHNQVLRKFRVKNPHGYDVGTLEKSKDSRYVRIYDTKNLQWDDENGRLIYVSPSQQPALKAPAGGMRGSNGGMSLVTSNLANGPLNPGVLIQSVDFEMNQYAPESEDRFLEVVEHQYTTLQSTTGARPQPLDEVPEWRTLFPSLANLEKKGDLHNCDIVLFDSGLSIGQPPRGKSRLSIKFNLDLYCHAGYRDWTIRTTFCEDKGVPKYSVLNTIETANRKDSNRTELVNVPFTSHWWRDLFSGIMKRRWERGQIDDRKIEEAGHGQCGEGCDGCQQLRQAADARLQVEDENSNRYLQELSVTQEVFASDRQAVGAGRSQRRVAIFLWRFRRVWPGEAATTIWRRLNHPNQPSSTIQTSIPPMAVSATTVATASPLTPMDKGISSAEVDYAGQSESAVAAAESNLPYDMNAGSYWDHSWVNTQLAAHVEVSDGSGSQNGSFPTCHSAGGLAYGHMDPSPTTQDSHDSGYASQGTSFASQTPTMLQSAHSTGGAEYAADGGHEYTYEDMMGMSNFDLSYEASGDLGKLPGVADELARLQQAVTDPNLFQFTNHLPLNFGLSDDTGAGLGLSASEPEESKPRDGPIGGIHAPQPLHYSNLFSGTTTHSNQASAPQPQQHQQSQQPPQQHCLPTPPAATDASMLLHLAQGGVSNSIGSAVSNVSGGSSSRGADTNTTPPSSATTSTLWGADALASLPSGLFLDVGAGLMLPGTSSSSSSAAAQAQRSSVSYSANRERAQESGRILGEIMGSGNGSHSQSQNNSRPPSSMRNGSRWQPREPDEDNETCPPTNASTAAAAGSLPEDEWRFRAHHPGHGHGHGHLAGHGHGHMPLVTPHGLPHGHGHHALHHPPAQGRMVGF